MQDSLGRPYLLDGRDVYLKVGVLADGETLEQFAEKREMSDNAILESINSLLDMGNKLREMK